MKENRRGRTFNGRIRDPENRETLVGNPRFGLRANYDFGNIIDDIKK